MDEAGWEQQADNERRRREEIFVCPYCGNERYSYNGTGSDISCCGEVGHAEQESK